MLVKMPHSNFKEKSQEFNTGVGKCPCGQTFEYTSERDMKMKLRMHRRFCSILLKVSISTEKLKRILCVSYQKTSHNNYPKCKVREKNKSTNKMKKDPSFGYPELRMYEDS